MVASTLRGVVCAALIGFSAGAQLQGHVKAQANLRAVATEDPKLGKDWHKDLGKGDKLHEKHDIDTKEGQNNATTPYESIQKRVENDLVHNAVPNLTHACDGAYEQDLRCGTEKPWSANSPFRPKVDSWMDQCRACKVRACNADLEMPDGDKGCRCVFQAKGDGFVSDCVNTNAGLGDWKACGPVRTCDKYGAGGQCVHPCWTMPSAKKASNPNVKIIDAEEVKHVTHVHDESIDFDETKEDDTEAEVEKEMADGKSDKVKKEEKDKKDKKDKDDKKKMGKPFWEDARRGVKDAMQSGASPTTTTLALLLVAASLTRMS